jgi:hypothetical protein
MRRKTGIGIGADPRGRPAGRLPAPETIDQGRTSPFCRTLVFAHCTHRRHLIQEGLPCRRAFTTEKGSRCWQND